MSDSNDNGYDFNKNTEKRLDLAALACADRIDADISSNCREIAQLFQSPDYNQSRAKLRVSSDALFNRVLDANDCVLNVDDEQARKSQRVQLHAEYFDYSKALDIPSPIVAINNARNACRSFLEHVGHIRTELRQWIHHAQIQVEQKHSRAHESYFEKERMKDSN